ncbi:MAG: dihydrolipoamide acetyltransferase family protein [Acidimicrobiales bacterium]
MATPVEMPKLGNTVEHCLLVAWRKRKGDVVSTGEVLAEMETDKATFDLTAPKGGTVLELFFDDGAMVPVFTNVCVIGEVGESFEEYRPKVPVRPVTAGTPVSAIAGSAQPVAGQVAVAPASDGGPNLARSRASNGAQPAAQPVVPAESIVAPVGRMSPRARRLAAERGLDSATLTGSGPGGRILERDVRAELGSTVPVSRTARYLLESGYEIRGAGSGLGGMVRASDLVPPPLRFTGMRERIARRMGESLASTAQYTLHASADATNLLALRRDIKASPGTPDITINDLVAFCVIRAVLEVPAVNAEFIEGRLYQRAHVNLGFACDTPRGLVVPVVHHAEELSVAELSGRMSALATRALEGTLGADDMVDATFTVSNLGGLGVESFTPVINPPQVAILGVDAITLRPVRMPDGGVEFVDVIGLSATFDHQVIDGAPGARFLNVVKQKIASVRSLCSI